MNRSGRLGQPEAAPIGRKGQVPGRGSVPASPPPPRQTVVPADGERRKEVTAFLLDRSSDPTGFSGLGIVAEGVEFSDGTVVLRWRSGRGHPPSTGFYASVKEMLAIHGHGGSTRVRWLYRTQVWRSA